MIVRWIVGVALLFGILWLMLPKTDEESLAKIASASMFKCTSDFREQVARQVIKQEPVAVEFKNKCPNLISALELGEQGRMVISSKKHQLKLTLIPIVEGGKVRWSCRGEPAARVAKLCTP